MTGRVFARCLTDTNDEIILVVRDVPERSASRHLHDNYGIKAVLDIGTRQDVCPNKAGSNIGAGLPKYA